MPIDYNTLMNWRIPDAQQDYTAKDCMLYALGIGFGAAPLDDRHLTHVYEQELTAFPSMAMVIATGGPWARATGTGIDYAKVVHAEQAFVLHRPLPVGGSAHSRSRVVEIIDKGAGRGAIVTMERDLFVDNDDAPVATLRSSLFCRGDGGCGGPSTPARKPDTMPDRAPDHVHSLPVAPHQALIYRLSGDYNEIHVAPAAAERAGFKAPILHGLCSFAMALRSVADSLNLAAPQITGASVRFTAIVYPGETLETSVWREGDTARFRTRVVERNVVALDFGSVRLGG